MRKQSLFEDCLLHRTTVFSRFSSFSFLRFVFFFSLRSDFFFFSLHHHLFSVSSVLQQLKKQCTNNNNRLQRKQLVKLSCHSVIFCTTFDQHFPFLKRPLYIFPISVYSFAMFDPPLQMPMPKRQFATPTPTVTPNPTPAASRTTSSVSIGTEPPVDEIREILLGQRLTPDPFSVDSSTTAQVTRQFSAMVLESTGLCCFFLFLKKGVFCLTIHGV